MRLILGIVLGIAIAVGAAFIHDNNVAPDPAPPLGAERQVVNWDVLGAVVRQQADFVRGLWDRAFGR